MGNTGLLPVMEGDQMVNLIEKVELLRQNQ